ncbi:MAG: hypothetical protein U9Q66_03830 [Patescibacteria group bacterium]|nr:hypothetical protein [Patescibacteria group bacterium]
MLISKILTITSRASAVVTLNISDLSHTVRVELTVLEFNELDCNLIIIKSLLLTFHVVPKIDHVFNTLS